MPGIERKIMGNKQKKKGENGEGKEKFSFAFTASRWPEVFPEVFPEVRVRARIHSFVRRQAESRTNHK